MDAALTLTGPLARAYGASLHAVAIADGELGVLESTRLDHLLERRCPGLDREDLFFERVTPESFAAAVRATADADATAIGLAFVADAVELGTVDGELRAVEAHAILRCARAFALGPFDVSSVTRALDEWIGALS
ncbi:MAG: hypothetical protein KBG48_12870 [Kofleriaceae bacterium]|jgi:hypothetical protein|nr:hypothetical protein [Kofleriaceae bacterium]MBP9168278.1 hypothetical protein [Kofleriaceae bacterium]MBP9862718.1 hypothetical protein [Kofleriaceae bacterium]